MQLMGGWTAQRKKSSKKISSLALMLISMLALLSFTAAAQATATVSVTPIDREITLGEEAIFEVTITNTGSERRTYTLYGLEVVWSVDPADKKFTLLSGQSKTTRVKVRPLGPFQPSTYAVRLYIDSSPSATELPTNRYQQDLSLVLFPEDPVDYLPSIRVTVDMDEKINPQRPVPIKLILENRNPLDLTGLLIRIQSEIPEFAQEVPVDLPSLETKTVDFTVTPSPFQQPKGYTLFFVFERQGNTVKIVEKQIEILPQVPAFTFEQQEEKAFLKVYRGLAVRNPGNVLNTQEVRVPVPFLERLFASGEQRSERAAGENYLIWEVSLGPDETLTIPYTVSYRVPVIVLILLLMFGLFYWYVKPPVTLRKQAVTAKGSEEGALSEIKVSLDVRNISNKPLKDVVITDPVPGIANLEKSLELGTLRPKEIKHTKHGSKVCWAIAELDPQEHRIITYKIKAKLNILGTFSLPRGVIEYKSLRGKRGKAYSNIFRVSS